jgi:NADPH2:quinone reductase
MRAILCRELSGLDGLHLADLPDPGQPGPGQVRVRIEAAGLNFADLLVTAGKYQVKHEPPFIPGFELSGVVEAIGAGIFHVRPGDKVMAISDSGAFAEIALVDGTTVFPAPRGLDAAEAAGFPIAYGTSYLALVEQARLQAGEILLVHGAAGGVGLTAVEIGKALGAKVIASAGGAGKCAVASAHGADRVIDYKNEDIRERVKVLAAALTDGERTGADVVYDPVGGEVFDASLRCVTWNARILIIGFAGGGVPQIPANILLVKNVAAMGFYFGSWRKHRPDLLAKAFAALDRMVEHRQVNPLVSHRVPLAEFRQALELVQSRQSTGKVVLTIA